MDLTYFAESVLKLKRQKDRFYCPDCDSEMNHRPNLVPLTKKYCCKRCGGSWFPDELAKLIGREDIAKQLRKEFIESQNCSKTSDNSSFSTEQTNFKGFPENKNKKKTQKEIEFEFQLLLQNSQPLLDCPKILKIVQDSRCWDIDIIKKCELRYLSQKLIFKFPEGYKHWNAGSYINLNNEKKWVIGWILFPYFNKSKQIIYFKGRKLVTDANDDDFERWHNMSGEIPSLYGAWLLDDYSLEDDVWICEGEADTLSLSSLDFNCVGITSATDFNDKWIELFEGRKVITCLDSDDAGIKGTEKVRKLLESVVKSITSFKIPDDFKDISDFYKNRKLAGKSNPEIRSEILNLLNQQEIKQK